MSASKYSAYVGADPYFMLIRKALGDLVDGEHFFDIVADDISYEVVMTSAGRASSEGGPS